MEKRLDFILRKLAFSIFTLILVLTFNFFLFRIVPGDPVAMMIPPNMKAESVENLRASFGLDKPVWLNTERSRGLPMLINTTVLFLLRIINSWAIASLGNKWPPVPPPAITMRNGRL